MGRRDRQLTRYRVPVAVALAVVAHVGVLVLIGALQGTPDARRSIAPSASQPASPESPEFEGQGAIASFVQLIDEVPEGTPLVPVFGAGDEYHATDEHPLPSADVDFPGKRAAGVGGGAQGGTETYAEHRYRQDARAEIWNHEDRYRQPRHGRDAHASSDESIPRSPDMGFDDRVANRRRLARDGAARGTPGIDDGVGVRDTNRRGFEPRWREMDPVFDSGAAKRFTERSSGAFTSGMKRPLTERGSAATESLRDGATFDDRNIAAASNERQPLPIDLSSPRSGGSANGRGVRGRRPGPGVSTVSLRRHGGTAATRAHVRRGSGRNAVRASRHNPYFRDMYRRIDKIVRFPHELALRLEQGELVIRFVLHADGRIVDYLLIKSSGFADFDRELRRAVLSAAPFGTVPKSLRGDRGQIRVIVPYAFRNPLIR